MWLKYCGHMARLRDFVLGIGNCFLTKTCPHGLQITGEMDAIIWPSPCLAVNFSRFLWAFVPTYTDLVVGLNLAKAGGVLIATTEQPFGLCEMNVVKVPSARRTFIHWECIKKVFINWSLCWHLWQSSQKLSVNRHYVRGWDLLASLSKNWYLLHIV